MTLYAFRFSTTLDSHARAVGYNWTLHLNGVEGGGVCEGRGCDEDGSGGYSLPTNLVVHLPLVN